MQNAKAAARHRNIDQAAVLWDRAISEAGLTLLPDRISAKLRSIIPLRLVRRLVSFAQLLDWRPKAPENEPERSGAAIDLFRFIS